MGVGKSGYRISDRVGRREMSENRWVGKATENTQDRQCGATMEIDNGQRGSEQGSGFDD